MAVISCSPSDIDYAKIEFDYTDQIASEIAAVKLVPDAAAIDGKNITDEVITFTMNSGTAYKVHMIPECFPSLEITGEGVAADNAGVYSIALDKFMIRVNTEGEIVYFRNMAQVGEELMAENFAPQPMADKQYYSAFVELHPEFRNANGGFSSGTVLLSSGKGPGAEDQAGAAQSE